MTSDDLIRQARQLEQERVETRVQLIEGLKAARDAEDIASDLLTTIKRRSRELPGVLQEHAASTRAAAEQLRDAARTETNGRRKAATAGGWTTAELQRLGLVKTRTKRTN